MKAMYFTFGTDEKFPYGIQDYVMVIGIDNHDCFCAFKQKFPHPDTPSQLNCADYYDPKQWEGIAPQYYDGVLPKAVVISNLAYGKKQDGYGSIWMFVPAKAQIVFMQEGSGDNLLQEDRDNGYVDYIDCTAYALDANGMVDEVDGGQLMTEYLIREKYTRLADAIPAVLDFLYDDMFMDAVILDSDRFSFN